MLPIMIHPSIAYGQHLFQDNNTFYHDELPQLGFYAERYLRSFWFLYLEVQVQLFAVLTSSSKYHLHAWQFNIALWTNSIIYRLVFHNHFSESILIVPTSPGPTTGINIFRFRKFREAYITPFSLCSPVGVFGE